MKKLLFGLSGNIVKNIQTKIDVQKIASTPFKDSLSPTFHFHKKQITKEKNKIVKPIKYRNEIDFDKETKHQIQKEEKIIAKSTKHRNEIIIEKMKKNMRLGDESMGFENLSPREAIKRYKMAYEIAENLLSLNNKPFAKEDKQELAKAYSGYADKLHRFRSTESELIEKLTTQALQLNSEDPNACSIYLSMHYLDHFTPVK